MKHDKHCTCGHEHSHEHTHGHHDEHCSCGHEHSHEHTHDHHDEHCSCGHEHYEDSCSHEHQPSHTPTYTPPTNLSGKRIVYLLENLGCAHCAAKMEEKINKLPEVQHATITFATKQLAVITEHPEHIQEKLQDICASIESEVKVIKKERRTTNTETKPIVNIGINKILARIEIILSVWK